MSNETLEPLRERVGRMISDGRVAIGNFTSSVRRQAGRADQTIRANPYRAVGIAAGAGLLAGFIFSRSRRGRRASGK
jgi:ElaB/YqjD/DUF883 family membrane-anchored ribosome-binding protein